MIETPTVTPHRCEARTGYVPGEFAFQPVRCNATIGLRTHVGSDGQPHYYCGSTGHDLLVVSRVGNMERITCSDPTHADGCPCVAGGDPVLR